MKDKMHKFGLPRELRLSTRPRRMRSRPAPKLCLDRMGRRPVRRLEGFWTLDSIELLTFPCLFAVFTFRKISKIVSRKLSRHGLVLFFRAEGHQRLPYQPQSGLATPSFRSSGRRED